MTIKTITSADIPTYQFVLENISSAGMNYTPFTTIALRELSIAAAVDSNVMLAALRDVKKSGQSDAHGLYAACRKAVGSRERRLAALSKWRLVFPLSIKLGSGVKMPLRFVVRGTHISVVPRASASAMLGGGVLRDPKALGKLVRLEKPSNPNFYLVLNAKGTNPSDAFGRVDDSFTDLLAAAEFSHSFGKWSWHWSLGPRPRRNFAYPQWCLAANELGELEVLYFEGEENYSETPVELTQQKIDSIRLVLSRTTGSAPKGSTRALVQDSLHLYGSAMNARTKGFQLLAFWQMAEAITRPDGGKSKSVVSRLAWHGKSLPGTGFRRSLARVASLRNNFVHRGLSKDIEDADISTLKLACEAAWNWLSTSTSSLQTIQDLEMFYASLETATPALRRRAEVIDFAIKSRI